jgi:hypothetical protein
LGADDKTDDAGVRAASAGAGGVREVRKDAIPPTRVTSERQRQVPRNARHQRRSAPFPEKDRGTFLVPRFGNMIEQVPDVGFDVLQVRWRESDGEVREAEVKTFMKPVSRPVDIHISGGKAPSSSTRESWAISARAPTRQAASWSCRL